MIVHDAAKPVPTWGKFVAVMLALGTLAISVPLVSVGAIWLVSVRITRQVELSAPLEAGQRLVVSADQATVELQPGQAGLVRVKVIDWTRVTTRGGLQPLQRATASLLSTPGGQRLEVHSAQGPDLNLGGETDVTVEVPIDTPLEVTASTVTAHGLTGNFRITTDQGTVSLREMTVRGSSSVRAAAATIDFSGIVDKGSLELTTGFGGIQAQLDRNSDARVEADASLGSISAGTGVGLTISGASVSRHGSAVIGAGTGLVTLRTALGIIRVEFS